MGISFFDILSRKMKNTYFLHKSGTNKNYNCHSNAS